MCLSQWIFEEETHKTYSWKYNKFLLESAKTHISSQKLHKCFLFCKLWQISFSDSLDRWQIPPCRGKWFVTTRPTRETWEKKAEKAETFWYLSLISNNHRSLTSSMLFPHMKYIFWSQLRKFRSYHASRFELCFCVFV